MGLESKWLASFSLVWLVILATHGMHTKNEIEERICDVSFKSIKQLISYSFLQQVYGLKV